MLCEHLRPHSAAYTRLHDAVDVVAEQWEKCVNADPTKTFSIKFVLAPGPISEPSRWIRSSAKLRPPSRSNDTLELLLVDDVSVEPVCFRFKAWTDSHAELKAELKDQDLLEYVCANPRRLFEFLDACTSTDSPLDNALRIRFGIDASANSTSARIAQDASADHFAAPDEPPQLAADEVRDTDADEDDDDADVGTDDDASAEEQSARSREQSQPISAPTMRPKPASDGPDLATNSPYGSMADNPELEQEREKENVKALERAHLERLRTRLLTVISAQRSGLMPTLPETAELSLEELDAQVHELLRTAKNGLSQITHPIAANNAVVESSVVAVG